MKQEEILDVVNEKDQVIQQASRTEIHRLGLRHRAVHILIFNRHGELFLQRRSQKKDCFPGAWDSSAAGHLDCGEEYDSCAVREVKEELGIELLSVPDRLFKIEACANTGWEFVWVYRCENEGPFQLAPDEIEEGSWFSLEKIAHWIKERPQDFADTVPLILERLENCDLHRH